MWGKKNTEGGKKRGWRERLPSAACGLGRERVPSTKKTIIKRRGVPPKCNLKTQPERQKHLSW